MKTPKRITYCECGCALNLESGEYMDDKGEFYNATALFCPKCGAAHPGEAFAARCIRKNRVARLKNALREKVWQIEVEKAKRKGYMRACVTLRSLLNKEMRLAAKYEKAVSASGTFGQDVEGS